MLKQEFEETQFCPGIRAIVKTESGEYDFPIAWVDFEDFTVGSSETNNNYQLAEIIKIYLPGEES